MARAENLAIVSCIFEKFKTPHFCSEIISDLIKDKKKSTPRRHHKSSTTNNGKNLDSGEPEERSGESAGTSARESESEAAPLSLQRPHSIPGEAGASSLGACSLQQVILNLGVLM